MIPISPVLIYELALLSKKVWDTMFASSVNIKTG